METIIVYVDDADYAQPQLQAAVQSHPAKLTHWVLVACAPRITHRVSKFVNNRSRESWRNKWADRLFHACLPLFAAHAAQVTPVLARAPLPELLQSLQAEHGAIARVLDMRRPKQHGAACATPAVPTAPTTALGKLAFTFAGCSTAWGFMVGEVIAT